MEIKINEKGTQVTLTAQERRGIHSTRRIALEAANHLGFDPECGVAPFLEALNGLDAITAPGTREPPK